MMKKKLFYNSFMCCLLILTTTIITGCSTQTKKNQIISIQKKRIYKLKKQLQRKNQVINRLKVKGWVNKKIKPNKAVVFKPLRSWMKKKQWVRALKESSRLKSIYPRSKYLRAARVKIFSKMGLGTQARREQLIIKKLRAQKSKRSMKR